MNEKILVTYASRFGATAGVAEAIGKTLAELGAQVDVLPMKEVIDLRAYRAVVAGSAINGGVWLPEALQFVRAHQAELRSKPFAAFLVCMTLSMKNGEQYRSTSPTGWIRCGRWCDRSAKACLPGRWISAKSHLQRPVEVPPERALRRLERGRPPRLECDPRLGGEPVSCAECLMPGSPHKNKRCSGSRTKSR